MIQILVNKIKIFQKTIKKFAKDFAAKGFAVLK